ncbi:MAG: translocation/assembly module TamB [Desulfamplus sp.]|nr:translocation/assembly module TamB [Desulfamplus sp.]
MAKKWSIIALLLFGLVAGLIAIIGYSLIFYTQSDNFSRFLKRQINQKIEGKMDWAELNLSLFESQLTIKDYTLSLNQEKIISLDRLHIDLDLSNFVKPLELSNVFNLSNLIGNQIIIKKIEIERPQITILLKNQGLNIASAFRVLDDSKDNNVDDSQFNFGFNLILKSLSLNQGSFKYVADNFDLAIDDINFYADANFAYKSNLLDILNRADSSNINFNLSMKSLGSEFNIGGGVKNIILPFDKDLNALSEPVFDLTVDANSISSKLLKLAGLKIDEDKISGNFSIKTSLSGSLNDPSIACEIGYLDKKIASSIDAVMQNRQIALKNFEIKSSDSSLKADGKISILAAFPNGFLAQNPNIENNQSNILDTILDKATGSISILGENIDVGSFLDAQNIELGIKGVASSFKVDFLGSLNNPNVKLSLNGENIGYKDYPIVDTADVDINLYNGAINIKKFDIDSCDSSVKLNGEIVLFEPQIKGSLKLMSDPLFDLFAESKNIDVIKLLNCLNVISDKDIKEQNIVLNLAAKSQLTGALKNLKLTLNASGKDAKFSGQHIESISLKALYHNKKSVVDSLVVALNSDNSLELKGSIDHALSSKVNANLYSKGVDLSLIESLKKSNVISGVASGSVLLDGSLKSIKSSKIVGDIALKRVKIVDKPFQDFSVKFDLKDNMLNVNGRLNFDVGAKFNFNSNDFSVQGIFNKTELLPWFLFAGVKEVENGSLTGTVNIKGNTKKLDAISGSCNLDELSLNLFKDTNDFSVKSKKQEKSMLLRAFNINGSIDGKDFKINRFKSLLPENGEALIAISGRIGGGVKAEAEATLPVKFASLFVKDMPKLKGSVKLNLKADIKEPDNYLNGSDIDATLEFIDIGAIFPVEISQDYPKKIELSKINGKIEANQNKIEISQITGNLSSGRVKGAKLGEFKLSGYADLINFMPHDIYATLKAKELPINLIEDLTGSFDADLKFKGDPKTSALLSGNIFINQALWTRDINVERHLFSTLTDAFMDKKRVRKEVDPKVKQPKNEVNTLIDSKSSEIEKMVQNMRLNIAVKGKKPVIVDNNLAYLEIRPDIRVVGTVVSPLVSGRSEINPGTINYQSTEFTLTRGIIDFVNPYKIEPEIDIQSHRKVRNWDITLGISGTPDNIHFELNSEPKLEDGDIISLLVRGRTVTELINSEGGTTLSAAGMLSQVAASAVSDRVKSATGLDIFEVGFNNRSDKLGSSDSDENIGDFNVTVGKELTDKITVKYSTENRDGVMVGKTSAEYKVMDSVSVSGFQDSEGQFGGEVRYRLEFR